MTFRNYKSQEVQLIANDLVYLEVPRKEPWGESIAVNSLFGPNCLENGNLYLEIEIQSGDTITLQAKTILLPEGAQGMESSV